ncbi:hypothetical protein SAMN04515647_4492 [Cohaesibacter sp. ES.047]|uniref:hypothetical protein n=1 Tax=Cohaesibacter sp. ES.047 TaxID=1798205 RepID=UPI000BB85E12|nr:hypothetical protein [Cohaesibacter sp. ES.047]SNY94168.1 hypothetical protein SAMN04515647_4492 [Cohaesibacter sp. ES.047]
MANASAKSKWGIRAHPVRYALIALCVVLLGSFAFLGLKTKAQVDEIFALNAERKQQGYFMAEFEFQMLSVIYHVDRGHYLTALSIIRAVHHKLESGEGLIKLPQDATPSQTLTFFKDLQQPDTGDFMQDKGYPVFASISVTANMINTIDGLSRKTGMPLELNHPMRFLEGFNEPGELIPLLDDLSMIGPFGARMPQTPFVEIGELIGFAQDLEELGMYKFSDAWHLAFIDWANSHQHPQTGLWGPHRADDPLPAGGGDITSSEKIAQVYLDNDGNRRRQDAPLQHRDQIFSTVLAHLNSAAPEEQSDLSDMHEWILSQNRGLRFITRYLWRELEADQRDVAHAKFETLIRTRFERTFIPSEKAFSLYPGEAHADLDGTGETLGILDELGVYSLERQNRLWGEQSTETKMLPPVTTNDMMAALRETFSQIQGGNSIRLHRIESSIFDPLKPDLIYRPITATIPDAVELAYGIEGWLVQTPQQMGNWMSKDSIRRRLPELEQIQPVILTDPSAALPPVFQRTGSSWQAIAYDILGRAIGQTILHPKTESKSEAVDSL